MDRFTELRRLTPKHIALKLKAYRKQYGMTQETLARRIGVKRNTVVRWETAEVKVSNVMLRMLMSEGVL